MQKKETSTYTFGAFFYVQQHRKQKKNAYILWCFYLKANICILHDKKIKIKKKQKTMICRMLKK